MPADETKDIRSARAEEQVAPQQADMVPKGGKGPTAASAADTAGAFGDREHDESTYSDADQTLLKGLKGGKGGADELGSEGSQPG